MMGYVHSVESFGTVDGPGIRYVVFMQGCPMRCLYCHNPDTWEPGLGEKKTADEILEEFEKCRAFLRNGGITVTGGEPLLQIDFVIELLEKAKNRKIHTCIDTSGITFDPDNEAIMKKMEALIQVTDLVLLDIKHIDDEEHKKLTGRSNKNILAFAGYLKEKKIPVWIRHVVVPGITYNEEYLRRLGLFLGDMTNMKALDVLPYHDLGKTKYESLGMDYPLKDIKPLDKQDAIRAREWIMAGIKERLRAKKNKM